MSLLPKPLQALAIRFDKSPITTMDAFVEFVQTRSSYVAQTSLYGYLKTRMGTSYREVMVDDTFVPVVRQSAARLFVSCLGDMTVFAVATAGREGALTRSESDEIARTCFSRGMANGLEGIESAVDQDERTAAFAERAAATDWQVMAEGENAFAGSARDLVAFAPVINQFKELDGEIVSNSIRFRWRDVREQLRKRVDGQALGEDWRRHADSG